MKELLRDFFSFLSGRSLPRDNVPSGCAFVFAWLFIGVMVVLGIVVIFEHAFKVS